MKFFVNILSVFFLVPFGASAFHSIEQKWSGDYYDENSSPQYQAAVTYLKTLKLCDYPEILDLGCGSGKVTEAMCKMAPSAKIEALDASQSMIQAAREKYNSLNKVTFNVKDAQNLNYCEKFDLVVSFSCLHWIENKEAVFRGIAQCLKPGGSILLVGCAKAPSDPIFRSFLDLKTREPWSAALSKVDTRTQYFPLEKETIAQFIHRVGLEAREVNEVKLPLRFKNKKALAAWFLGWLGGLPALAGLPKEQQQAFASALVEQYSSYVPAEKDGSIEYKWPLIVVKAKKALRPRDRGERHG